MQSSIKPHRSSFFSSLKRIFIVFLIFVILFSALLLYFWYHALVKTNQEAQIVLIKAQKFDRLENALHTEQARCQAFINSGAGDFSQFDYCKRFLDWESKVL